jgi:hypothetical protein
LDPVEYRNQQILAKETEIMRQIRALLAILTLATFALGCEGEAPKKAPEQKQDLGAPASPSTATPAKK